MPVTRPRPTRSVHGVPMVPRRLHRLAATGRATGQALAEYGLILALIAVVAISAALYLGGQISSTLSNVGDQINAAAGSAAPATTPPTAYKNKTACKAAGYTWVAKKGKVTAHCE